MGRRKKVLINTPHLNEYVYHKMYGFQGQKSLPPHLRKHFDSDKAAEKFASESGLEEKVELLSEMGVDFVICFKDKGWKSEGLKAAVKSVKAQGMVAARKQVSDNELALFSNIDYWMAITLMTGASNTSFYGMDLELRKAFYHKEKWKNRLESRDLEAFKRNEDSVSFYSKLYVSMIFQQRLAESNFQIKSEEVDILMYLYSKGRSYVPQEKIRDEFLYAYAKGTTTLAINRLRKNMLVDTNPLTERNEYIITGLGIQKAASFLKKTLSI